MVMLWVVHFHFHSSLLACLLLDCIAMALMGQLCSHLHCSLFTVVHYSFGSVLGLGQGWRHVHIEFSVVFIPR